MADSTFLKIPLLSTSQSAKETTINTMISYLERSMNDAQTLSLAAGNVNMTETDLARFFMFRLTGVVSGRSITIPNMKRLFVMENLTGAFTVSLQRGASTLTIPIGGVVVVYCDGANLISVADSTVTGGGGGGATSFVTLVDTFSSYAGLGGHLLRVKAAEDGIESFEIELADLADIDTTDVADGYTLAYNATTEKWHAVEASSGGGASTAILKQAVRTATTEEIVIDSQLVIGTVIDGVTLAEGDRVLVKNQTTQSENGIWVVTLTTPVRAADANSSGDISEGTMVVSVAGLLSARLLYVQTAPDVGGIIPGSSPMVWQSASVTLASLTDVDSTSAPDDGDVLIWDEATSKWKPGPVTVEADLPPKVGNAGKVLAVNATEDGIEWVEGGGDATYPDMTGNTGKVLAVNATEDGVEWVDQSGGGSAGIPILSIFYPGVTGDNETIYRWTAPVVLNFPIGLTGSKFTAGIAATASTVFTLKKNGTDIGTITFAASGTTGTVSFTGVQVFNINDTLTIVGPVTADTTLADLSMSFKGTA